LPICADELWHRGLGVVLSGCADLIVALIR
jgi:hypothetical protein